MSVVPVTKCNFVSQAFNSQTGSKRAAPDGEVWVVLRMESLQTDAACDWCQTK